MSLVALDLNTDMTTPTGEAMAGVAGVFSQLERRLISDRTREALAAARSRGTRLGGRKVVPDDTRRRIAAMKADGMTLQAIADTLNDDGVRTGKQGARWWPSTVRSILRAA